MLGMKITMVMVATVDFQINKTCRETNNKIRTNMGKMMTKTTKD